MLKLGKISLNGIPRIVVPFSDGTPPAVLRKVKKSGMDIAELRIDQLMK